MVLLYSNYLGVYCFNEKLELIEERVFDDPQVKCRLLEEGKWLPEELELIKKHSHERIIFLGIKNSPMQNVVQSQDQAKLARFSTQENLHKLATIITKKKLSESVNDDLLINQSSNAIEDLNKAANLLSKRLREWYELHNPEFSRKVDDHEKFAELAAIKTRKELLGEIGLLEKDSMGALLEEKDRNAMELLASEISNMFKLREKEKEYLETLMKKHCKNVNEVAGSLIGGKLITLAGSLKRLSEMPASTIQLLGAEKALFRHMKTGARSPKYGIIFNHPLVQKADRKSSGKAARALADKIAIAAKVDYFKGVFIGDKLVKDLEKKLK